MPENALADPARASLALLVPPPALSVPPGDPPPAAAPAALYLARLAPASRRTMLGALRKAADLLTGSPEDPARFPWSEIRYVHTTYVRARLLERCSPAYANKILSALRGVLRESWRLGLMPREDFERARDLPQVRGSGLPRGRALSEGELGALLVATTRAGGPGGLRDAALVALLYGGGLRRSEVVALDLDDVQVGRGEVRVRSGKGHKARRVYLSADVRGRLRAWISVRGSDPGPFFTRVLRGGHVRPLRITDQTVYDVILRRSREAGIERVSPHDFRRTMATRLLDAGADLAVVRGILGHAEISTTLRYDHRGEAPRRAAACRLRLPRSDGSGA